MSDEADPILMFFTEAEAENPDTLYTALGVGRDAAIGAIRLAYRRAALRCHPDKHAGKPAAEVEKLVAEFQKVGFAWAVLSDEKRRKRYDTTGRTDELKFADAEESGWDAYFEELFERVDRKMLDDDKEKYQGSEAELADLREAYTSTKGSFGEILARIPHSTVDDEARLIAAVEGEISAGNLKRTKAWTASSEDGAAATKRKRKAAAEAEAAEEAARELGVWDEFYGSGKKGRRAGDKGKGKENKAEGEDALAALIVRRQSKPSALDAIANKYAGKEKGKGKSKGKGKKEAAHDDLDDDAFAALQAKMFGGKGKKKETAPAHDDLDDDAFAALQAKMFGDKGKGGEKKKRKTK